MADTSSQKVIQYVADTRDVLSKIGQIIKANQTMAKNLGNDFTKSIKTIDQGVGKLSKIDVFDSKGVLQSSQAVEKFSNNIKLADGSLGKYTETVKSNADGTKSINRSFSDLDKNTVSLSENIYRLAKRAALTIPLWLLLRGAIMGVIGSIKGGFRDILEFDKALQKLRKNLQGTPEEIQRNFETAKRTITDFAISSGKSTEDITKSIQRFATVGFDFNTAMQAGLDATRLSVLLFGDAEETANAFARALRVLVTNVNDSSKSQTEISQALALTSQLWETNAFEINELNGGLEKFAGTAKSMNFTINETLTLLAALSTRGLNAERAGTLLRTSTQKLEQNLSKIAKVLGIQVNPEVDRTFDVFVRVTNAISKLKSEAGTISPAVSNAIGELFGGVRGGEPIRDLIADMAEVNKSFQKFANIRPDIVKFHTDFNNMNDTIFRQVEIMHNLNKETGKAFVTGIVGGKDFLDSLKSINDILSSLTSNAQSFGSGLRIAFLTGTLQVGALVKEFQKLDEIKLTKAQKEAEKLFKVSTIQSVKEIDELLNNINKKVPVGLFGFTQTAQNEIVSLLKARKAELEKVAIEEANITKEKEKQQIITENQTLESNRQKLAEVLLKSELERLKTLGASNSQLIKAEQTYIKLLGLSREEEDVLSKKLDLERSIVEEKRLQSKLGSDSIKLFKIAQEQGTDIAKKVGDALAGNIDFSSFIRRGGEAVDIFKKEFSDLFEQQQALAFFKGERVPGVTGLRGGTQIPILEELTRKPVTTTNMLSQIGKATREIKKIELDININGKTLSLLPKGDSKTVANQVVDQILPTLREQVAKELADPNSLIGRQDRDNINNF